VAIAAAHASHRASLSPQSLGKVRPGIAQVLSKAMSSVERPRANRRHTLTAAGALALLAECSEPEDAAALFRALLTRDPMVVAQSARALGKAAEKFGSASVLLMSVIRGSHQLSTLTTVWAIEKVFARFPEQLLSMSCEPDVRSRALIVRYAGQVLQYFSESAVAERTTPYRALCRAALADPAEVVRQAAARGLHGVSDEPSIRALVTALDDPCQDVQIAAADALAGSNTPAGFAALAAKLTSAAPAVRQALLGSVARRRPAAPASLLLWLSSGDEGKVAAALDLLAVVRPEQRIVDALFSILRKKDPALKRAAARALAALVRENTLLFRGGDNIERLVFALDTDDSESVGALVETLALTGDERVIAPLMARIPISGRYVREKVVEGLALLDLARDHAGWIRADGGDRTVVIAR
jgi:HEAT repeat protein